MESQQKNLFFTGKQEASEYSHESHKNIRWKALDEIYKIYMLLHRSNFNISAFFQISSNFSSIFAKLNVVIEVVLEVSSNFAQFLINKSRSFAKYSSKY